MASSIAAFFLSHLISRFADQGLANASGLATLRHGTNPFSWLSIHCTGADPSWGDSKIGADAYDNLEKIDKGRFYLAQDPKYYEGDNPLGIVSRITPRFIPLIFGHGSTENFLIKLGGKRFSRLWRILSFSSVLIPSIKFRLPDEVCSKFEKSPLMPLNTAVFTTEKISAWNIGFVGTVWNSFTPKIISRIRENPSRVITGVAEIAFCAASFYFASPFLLAHKIAMFAGAIFACV